MWVRRAGAGSDTREGADTCGGDPGAQLKEKKRQRLMKNMEDGRARVRQQKLEVRVTRVGLCDVNARMCAILCHALDDALDDGVGLPSGCGVSADARLGRSETQSGGGGVPCRPPGVSFAVFIT